MKRSSFLFGFIIFALSFLFIKDVNAEALTTGTYKIVNANDESKFLIEKNGNIELGNSNSGGETSWDVVYDGVSYYIKSHSDNNVAIDITGRLIRNGTNIHTYSVNNTDAQKWNLESVGDYYYIKSILGNYCIDVASGLTNVGANIQLYESNGTNAQKWKLIKQEPSPQSLSDGTYIIKSKVNNSNVLDLVGGSTRNLTNVQIYSNNYTWAQIWNIKYENGYYRISSYLDNNKVLDVSGAAFRNTSNIQLYESNGTNAQKFSIIENSDNTYTIKSYNDSFSIDVSGASSSPGANIQLYKDNGTNAQKFEFEKVGIDPPESGYYIINSLLDNNKVVGVSNSAIANGKNIDLRSNNNKNYRKWYLERIERDIYVIKNGDNTKYVMDVYGGYTKSGSNVQLYKSNGSNAQKWVIRKTDDGNYKIIGLGSAKSLDITSASTNEGANIQIYEPNNSSAQKFNFTKTEVTQYTKAYDDGNYIIKSAIDNNKVLDIFGASKNNGANVQVYSSNSTNAQVWRLEYLDDGIYVVRSLINPNLVLAASGNNAVSTKYTGDNSQKWYFDRSGDNTNIINLANSKYLKVDSNNPSNSTNVSLSDNVTNQNKFVLTNHTGTIKYKGVDISKHNTITSWDQLSSQIDFAVLRIGYGGDATSQDDPKFLSYLQACEQYNIPYAVYVYSYAVDDGGAVDESNHMLRQIRNNGAKPNLTTQVYYDQEDTSYIDQSKISNATRTSMVNTFCNRIRANGYKCGVYASKSWLEGMLDINSIKPPHEVWVAHWLGFNTFDQGLISGTSYQKTSYAIWQFTGSGNLPGVSGRIDMDIGYNIFD